jgi:hypothetical protein
MITIKRLARSIEMRMGHSASESIEEARTILNYFGFEDTIIDNAIEPEDRKLFYALHDAGLLQSYWESVPLLDGRHWRIFYWTLDEKTVDRLAKGEEPATEDQLYQTLPDEVWSHTPLVL